MQIDRNIKPAKKEITWLKQFSSGVSFKKLYKKDKRGMEFITDIKGLL